MSTKTKRPAERRRPVQHPKRRATTAGRNRRWVIGAAIVAVLIAVAAGVALAVRDGDDATVGEPVVAEPGGGEAAGLPNTPDYHSLLVAPDDPDALTLGTHDGLYQSADGGRTWEKAALDGQDAMSLDRGSEGLVWTAGHEVFAQSSDGGETWQPVRPQALPHLDIHGFALDPRDPQTMYAALAGTGLFRSSDGGERFEFVSRDVGPAVMALAVMREGRILAGDMQQGLMVSDDGGRSWNRTLPAALMGLAVNPAEPERVLATGPGVLLSTDAGDTWNEVMPLGEGAGPVAWAPSEPSTAYVVGFDRTLYKTTDGGQSWQPVT